MKFIGLPWALPPAILAVVFSATAFAGDAGTAAVSEGGVQAKIKYCQDCHGLSGQGYRGFLPIPRIAGQPARYIENQLLDFAETRRDKDISVEMPKVHGVSPSMRPALAAHFSELDPGPAGDGPPNLVVAGGKIYEEGIPEANVPACSACHGPAAKGKAEIPRLAGQLYPYTVKELTRWSIERGHGSGKEDLSSVMAPIAHDLSQSQAAAVSAYLSYLK